MSQIQSEFPGYNNYQHGYPEAKQEDMILPTQGNSKIDTFESVRRRLTAHAIRPQFAPHSHGRGKRRRTAFTSVQLSTLEKLFATEPYLCKVKRSELAEELTVSEITLKVWFQNRRQKQKREKEARPNRRGNTHFASDQSETSSMVSCTTAVYSDYNKNIEKGPNDSGVVMNDTNHNDSMTVQQIGNFEESKNASVQQIDNFDGHKAVGNENHVGSFGDSKIVGHTVHHYPGNFNSNFNYNDNFGYNNNYDPFFDPYMGYNFANSFDNMFSTFGTQNYYNQQAPPMPMQNMAYRNPMTIDCNADGFVGPM